MLMFFLSVHENVLWVLVSMSTKKKSSAEDFLKGIFVHTFGLIRMTTALSYSVLIKVYAVNG